MTIQAQILELMKSLQEELGMAIIMITHDLGVVAQLCDEVIVMYAGSICEQGTADEIFYNPKHEYTRGLLRSIPTADTAGTRLKPISGTPIDLLNMPKGCPFAPRCDNAMKICLRERCERMQINENHQAACWMNRKPETFPTAPKEERDVSEMPYWERPVGTFFKETPKDEAAEEPFLPEDDISGIVSLGSGVVPEGLRPEGAVPGGGTGVPHGTVPGGVNPDGKPSGGTEGSEKGGAFQ